MKIITWILGLIVTIGFISVFTGWTWVVIDVSFGFLKETILPVKLLGYPIAIVIAGYPWFYSIAYIIKHLDD